MTQPIPFPQGHYHYLPGGFQYSAAVMADTGYRLERARFQQPVSLSQAFKRMADHLASRGRPLTALCSCELRSPAQFNEPEFIAFNRGYVQTLEQWGLYKDEKNPVARCNLIPVDQPPSQPSIYAFSYTVPEQTETAIPDFITSGAAECPDIPGYRDHIVRLGETTPDTLHDKLRYALSDLESRLIRIGLSWDNTTDFHLYSAHAPNPAQINELNQRGLFRNGLGWHRVRPPIIDIEIEIDAHKVSHQLLLPG